MSHYRSTLSAFIFLTAAGVWAGTEDMDFDGDGKADHAVYHAARGEWYVRYSRDAGMLFKGWGWKQSQPVPGDYDGDRKADVCVYSARGGDWYVLRSSDGVAAIQRGWGGTQHDPVAGDFDGDGRNDMATYEPTSGRWYVLQSSNGARVNWQWGHPRAEPVPGDYDGDGTTDSAIYERATGLWSIFQSSNHLGRHLNWGWAEAEPVQADYDGDGTTDIAVFHPATGDWYIRRSSDEKLLVVRSGWRNAQPVPGDFNGDGKAEPGIYYAPNGAWLTMAGSSQALQNWGWSQAEAAFAAYRVDDDGVHYGTGFDHDYDEDTFQVYGEYPRTGWHPPAPNVPVNLAQVTWLHEDVSTWAQTSKLRVRVNKSTITLSYDKASAWPDTYSIGGASVSANPWIFVRQAGGTGWHGATWEWMKRGQTTKNRSSVAGDHIKRSPLGDFKPVPGQWYGFMVSGLARDRNRNVSERTNVVMVQWPEEGKTTDWFE